MTSSQNSVTQASAQIGKTSCIPNFSKANLLIVGDIMLDRYYVGPTTRISPEAPVPIVNVKECEERPGGAANVAVNAAMLGANVTLMGFVGNDQAAQILRNALQAHKVNCDFNVLDDQDTIIKLRVMSRHQQLLRLDFESSFVDIDKSDLLARYKKHLEHVDIVVLSDYAKGALSEVEVLIEVAIAADVPVVVDPKSDSFERYKGASIITPNMPEFEAVYGKSENESKLLKNALRCCKENNVQHLLLTRSEKGMSLFSVASAGVGAGAEDEISSLHLPALAREVFDVTGAGDTVVSTLACTIGAQESIALACQLANHAAGVVVGKLGTSSVTTTELALAMNQHKNIDSGVLNQEQLILAVKQAQLNGEKVVMTNGCFDILHAGHVSYLSEAASLGERLVVAVNADASVTKLKGEWRPINNVARRMAVLAGLASVDWVVEFSEETPQRLIAEVLPDILVKGGDYAVEDIAGGTDVIANGGEVMSLGFKDGVSTSAIIKEILNK